MVQGHHRAVSGTKASDTLDSEHDRDGLTAAPLATSPTGTREETSMSDFDRNTAARRGFGAAGAVAIDAGLRAYMIRVYNYMAAGVALTGVVAWLTYSAAVVTDAAGHITGLTPFGQAIFG